MNSTKTLIVSDYLESLKEDGELDYIFPLLLEAMDFQIITKPRYSKGQSQYGKDIVAVSKENNELIRYYFEIKGGSDRHITDITLTKNDGIIQSMRAAKYTPYIDTSISNFSILPIKYVLVHNGGINENAKPTLEGFIQGEFPNGNFERWGIERLSQLFSEHLFNEYLLVEGGNFKLFKKTLILLNSPDYDFIDFKNLADSLLESAGSKDNRVRNKFFATLTLLISVVFHFCKEDNNIEPAKQCGSYLCLKTWAWILKHKLEKKPKIIQAFRKILGVHFQIIHDYFERTISIVKLEDGLFSEVGGAFEAIGYPLRSMEYVNYLVYYFKLSLYLYGNDSVEENKNILIEIIKNNDGCRRPLLDNHSIAIGNVVLFILDNNPNPKEIEFLNYYVKDIFYNTYITSITRKRLPELYNNLDALIDTVATMQKSNEYIDSSSFLITMLFEFCIILGSKDIYQAGRHYFKGKLNLQVYYPDFDFDEFANKLKSTDSFHPFYRTDQVGLSCLRTLAHIYFKTPLFVNEWRNRL